jgi:hypothetical protein
VNHPAATIPLSGQPQRRYGYFETPGLRVRPPTRMSALLSNATTCGADLTHSISSSAIESRRMYLLVPRRTTQDWVLKCLQAGRALPLLSPVSPVGGMALACTPLCAKPHHGTPGNPPLLDALAPIRAHSLIPSVVANRQVHHECLSPSLMPSRTESPFSATEPSWHDVSTRTIST